MDLGPHATFIIASYAASAFILAILIGWIVIENRALKRTDPGLAQDVHQGPGVSLTIPAEGRIFSYVYIDPANPLWSAVVEWLA